MSILLIPLTLICAAVWVAIVSPVTGRLLAVPLVGATLLLTTIVLLLVTPFLALPLGIVVLAALTLFSIAGIALLLRSPARRGMPSLHALTLWLPSLLGAVGWVAARAASFAVPGASRVSWAMEGDTTNNLHFARLIVEHNGIALGPDENPVPLAASLLALPLSLAQTVGSGASLESDLSIFAAVWTIMLAACCVAMGVVVASLIDPRRRVTVAVASAIGSLLPLTWFVAGLPIEYGYFNVHVALPLLLASWLAYLGARRSPAIALGALVCLSALLLVTWSPVVLVPVVLGAMLSARHRSRLLAMRPVAALFPFFSAAVFVLLTSCLTVPALFAQSAALEAPGHGFPATWVLSSALAIATLVAAALLRSRVDAGVFAGVVAVVLASYAALVSTFYVARDNFDPWDAYYPVKLAWLIAVVLLPVFASLLVAAAATLERRALRIAAVALAAALVVALAAAPPVTRPDGYVARQPLDRILGGHVWRTGDAAVAIVVALAARGDVAILWKSDSPDEALINYWAIDAAGGDLGGDQSLRDFAFKEYRSFRTSGGHNVFSQNALCALLRDRDHAITVYTDDSSLESDFAENCTGASATYVVGATPGARY